MMDNTPSVKCYPIYVCYMCVCVYVYIYIYIYIYIHIHIYTYVYIYIHACMHIYICIYIYTHVYIYIEREREMHILYVYVYQLAYVTTLGVARRLSRIELITRRIDLYQCRINYVQTCIKHALII